MRPERIRAEHPEGSDTTRARRMRRLAQSALSRHPRRSLGLTAERPRREAEHREGSRSRSHRLSRMRGRQNAEGEQNKRQRQRRRAASTWWAVAEHVGSPAPFPATAAHENAPARRTPAGRQRRQPGAHTYGRRTREGENDKEAERRCWKAGRGEHHKLSQWFLLSLSLVSSLSLDAKANAAAPLPPKAAASRTIAMFVAFAARWERGRVLRLLSRGKVRAKALYACACGCLYERHSFVQKMSVYPEH